MSLNDSKVAFFWVKPALPIHIGVKKIANMYAFPILRLTPDYWMENDSKYQVIRFSDKVLTIRGKLLGRLLPFSNFAKGPFIYYVITFLEFLDPPPHLRKHVLVMKIIKNWHFLTPLPPLQVIIYEWSLMLLAI